MKTINWLTLNQFSIDDIVVFIHWLGFTSKGQVTSTQIHGHTPIRSSKVPGLIKILDYFNFAVRSGDKLQITRNGRDFERANASLKFEILNGKFSEDETIKKILLRLEQSPSGRLNVNTVAEILQDTYDTRVSRDDVSGLIAWATTCKLFVYDEDRNEIVHIGGRLPRNPLAPNLAS